jgi:hypothetical protein
MSTSLKASRVLCDSGKADVRFPVTTGWFTGTARYVTESFEKEATVVDCGVTRDGWRAIIGLEEEGSGGNSCSYPVNLRPDVRMVMVLVGFTTPCTSSTPAATLP